MRDFLGSQRHIVKLRHVGGIDRAIIPASLTFIAAMATLFLSACEEPRTAQDMISELEQKCAAAAKDLPPSMGTKKDFYDACVFGGKSNLRSRGLIP